MSTKARPEVASRATFLNRADRLAKNVADLEQMEADLEAEIAAIKKSRSAKINAAKQAVKAEKAALADWADKNRDELFEDGAKSANTLLAEFGFRKTPGKIVQCNRKWKVADSIAAIQKAGLDHLLDVKTTLNKDGIMDAMGDDPEKLRTIGLRNKSSDEFFIKLRRSTSKNAA